MMVPREASARVTPQEQGSWLASPSQLEKQLREMRRENEQLRSSLAVAQQAVGNPPGAEAYVEAAAAAERSARMWQQAAQQLRAENQTLRGQLHALQQQHGLEPGRPHAPQGHEATMPRPPPPPPYPAPRATV